uniref:Uncharacterized protein n=1 Tax=Arundo donax TaxID=35708 RepID=A0A0A9HW92_ARUDO
MAPGEGGHLKQLHRLLQTHPPPKSICSPLEPLSQYPFHQNQSNLSAENKSWALPKLTLAEGLDQSQSHCSCPVQAVELQSHFQMEETTNLSFVTRLMKCIHRQVYVS